MFTVRKLRAGIIALWIGFGVGAAWGQPGPTDQQLADTVARVLRESGKFRQYRVDIQVIQGEVELVGRVADARQHDDALWLTRSVPGVRKVHDRLQLGDRPILPVQAQIQDQPELGPLPNRIEQAPAMPLAPMPPVPGMSCPTDPIPYCSGSPNDQFMKPPPLPPYAWPTYAPYNNYSRVAYPTLYPAEAWPGIGPVYPFPKPPLGWRSVTLTWQDGYWWYGKGVSSHDWWRLRYK